MGKRFIVCGGRKFDDAEAVHKALSRLHAKVEIVEIAEGGAKGADRHARKWAESHGIPVQTFPADWERYGVRAGPIRNADMLAQFKPDGVVAFPGGPGTISMMAIARMAKVTVWEPLKKPDEAT
jgi:hypothetical protein